MDHLSISPEDSVAIVESQGFMAAARLVQLLSQESRARVVAVSPMNAAGAITTVIAGPLAEVQYALTLAKSGNAISDSTFFARPQIETIEMLLRSALGGTQGSAPAPRKVKQPDPLPLFEAPVVEERRAYEPPPTVSKPVAQPRPQASPASRQNGIASNGVAKPSNGVAKRETTQSNDFEPIPYYELESYPVHELRRYARSIPGFPIHGREISKANRSELLQLIKTTEERTRTQAARDAASGVIAHEELMSNITHN